MNGNMLKEVSVEISSKQVFVQYGVSDEYVSKLLTAGVVLLPDIQREGIKTFHIGFDEFYSYCKANNIDIEVCAEGNPNVIELCSSEIRLGHIFVSAIALPLLLNVMGNYIYQKISDATPQQTQTIVQEYQFEPTVSFTLEVEDSCGVVKKRYSYEGPAKDINEVTKHIENLWNDSTNK